MYKYFEMNNM